MHSNALVVLSLAAAATATPLFSLTKRQEILPATGYVLGADGVTCSHDPGITGLAGDITAHARGFISTMFQPFFVNNVGPGCTVMYKQDGAVNGIRVSLCTTDPAIVAQSFVTQEDATAALDTFKAKCDPEKNQEYLGGVVAVPNSVKKDGTMLLFDRWDMR